MGFTEKGEHGTFKSKVEVGYIGNMWNEHWVLNLRNKNNVYLVHGNMAVSITLPRGMAPLNRRCA